MDEATWTWLDKYIGQLAIVILFTAKLCLKLNWFSMLSSDWKRISYYDMDANTTSPIIGQKKSK